MAGAPPPACRPHLQKRLHSYLSNPMRRCGRGHSDRITRETCFRAASKCPIPRPGDARWLGLKPNPLQAPRAAVRVSEPVDNMRQAVGRRAFAGLFVDEE